jgi:hypothetical protein
METFLQSSPDAVEVPLLKHSLDTNSLYIEDLTCAAFVASEVLRFVWDNEAPPLVQRAKAIESELVELG